MRIVIEVPDDDRVAKEYIQKVAEQLGEGYLSGYVDSETYWDII
jgi:hypothetical protein